MLDIRALCFDVDGTLIDDEKLIGAATAARVREAAEVFGCRVILASSRMPRSLRGVAAELGLDCDLAAYDGALCVRGTGARAGVCADRKIEDYDTAAFDSLPLGTGLFCGVFDGETWIASSGGRWLDRELRSTKVFPDVVDEDLLRETVRSGRPLNKIMVRGEPSEVALARAALGTFTERFVWYSNKDTILEILPAGSSKARGVAEILSIADGVLPGVVAFGDGYNDVGLMRAAEISVAMGNAVADCRAAARYSTGDNNSDGIAAFLSRLIAEGRPESVRSSVYGAAGPC